MKWKKPLESNTWNCVVFFPSLWHRGPVDDGHYIIPEQRPGIARRPLDRCELSYSVLFCSSLLLLLLLLTCALSQGTWIPATNLLHNVFQTSLQPTYLFPSLLGDYK